MIQTNLSRYERRSIGENEPLGHSENILTEDSGPNSSEAEFSLDPDERAVLDYVQQNGHVAKEELHHRSGIPNTRLDGILETLEDLGLIDISVGYTVVQIQSRNEESIGAGGICQ